MATTVTAFNVHDLVYHVDATLGVRDGVVHAVDTAFRPNGSPMGYSTVSTYGITLVDTAQPVLHIAEDALYADIDAALAAYKVLIQA